MARTSRRVGTGVVLLIAVLAVAFAAMILRDRDEDDSGVSPSTATVVIAQIAFAPAALTVARGTAVVFRNEDGVPHTVTARGGGSVNSGVIDPGDTFRLVVDHPFDYLCVIHPQMKAKVLLTG